MANYLLYPTSNNVYGASSTSYSNEYAEGFDLHLRDEIHADQFRNTTGYFRLYAKEPHTIEQALAYNIRCPKCSVGILKQVGRCKNAHELGLYECPICKKH